MTSMTRIVKSLCYCLICLAVVLSLASGVAMAGTAPATAWEKNIGESNFDEVGESVWQTSDNGFIIAGRKQVSTGLAIAALVKTDWQGNLQWMKTYEDANGIVFVRQTNDSGYIATGTHGGNLYVLKTDENGEKQWSNTYPRFGGVVNGYSIHQLPDGGYVVAGNVARGGKEGDEMYLARIDSTGKMLWEKAYSGIVGKENNRDYCYSVWPTNDGGFVLAGSVTTEGYKAALIKVDADGNRQWSKVYTEIEGRQDGNSMDVQQTRDGGYIYGGVSGGRMMLIKTDANGDLQWNQFFKEGQQIFSVQQTWDDGYVFTGGNGAFPNATLVIRTDPKGNQLWQKWLTGVGISFSSSVQQIGNGSYVVTGITKVKGEQPDLYLAQLEKDMTPAPNAQLVSPTGMLQMEAGQAYTVTVSLTNNGTMPWTFQDGTVLVPTGGASGDAALFGIKENHTIPIGTVIRPGQGIKVDYQMTAPAMNGTYNPEVRMFWINHGLFGAPANIAVKVVNGTPDTRKPTVVATAAPTAKPVTGTTEKPAATPTSEQPVPTAAEKKQGLPCLPSVVLPLLIVGTVGVGLYQRRKRDN